MDLLPLSFRSPPAEKARADFARRVLVGTFDLRGKPSDRALAEMTEASRVMVAKAVGADLRTSWHDLEDQFLRPLDEGWSHTNKAGPSLEQQATMKAVARAVGVDADFHMRATRAATIAPVMETSQRLVAIRYFANTFGAGDDSFRPGAEKRSHDL
jgi:hypothetical protein